MAPSTPRAGSQVGQPEASRALCPTSPLLPAGKTEGRWCLIPKSIFLEF